ncbi:helix-turn-helix domain-containing protein [Paenibacillus sp. IB182496]|uniref:Helix-turn-helix domain-containing protein n=1 Tax=Paenibacillus sabuli TaxID=2772509 RepID=A0A927BP58_9BACL|nr:helix-turn-helix domain-containing protein [Paenibacillus sabuli]MBD2844151.1 helix-turn-helix domain-containing protein [Paenibacillus sabuli]
MIRATTEEQWLPLYEALASEVRLRILRLLETRETPANIKELAAALGLSSAIVTMHVRKLEKGGLIQTRMVRRDGGTHKLCELAAAEVHIAVHQTQGNTAQYHEVFVPVGHYSEFEVHPTCGIATKDKLIGQHDDPRYFLEPERMYAHILWFAEGYVSYRVPNYLLPGQQVDEIEIAVEIGSEAPGYNENWPSDIHFHLNDVALGVWTCPGDFGEKRGRYTPAWWHSSINQHGLLKVLRLRRDGTYLDGQRLSDVGLGAIPVDRNQWTLRFSVPADAQHVGGLTLYGEGFGNYNEDIRFKVYYRETAPSVL